MKSLISSFIIFCFSLALHANAIKSNTEKLDFIINQKSNRSMRLTELGLAIGSHSASANLDVAGNAIVHEKLCIGENKIPSSNLHLSGIMSLSSQTINNSDTEFLSSLILADSSSSNLSLNLPNPASYPGAIFHIKRTSISNNVVVSSNTYIDHPSQYHISLNNFAAVVLVSQSSHYLILSDYGTTTSYTWQPSSLGNLIGWYDTSDSTTINFNSGVVDQLNDKSDFANHVTQDTSSKRPQYNRLLNGRSILHFDGNDFLTKDNFPIPNSGNVSFFMVAEIDNVDHSSESIFSVDGASDFQYNAGVANQFQAKIITTNLGGTIDGITDYIASPHLFQVSFDFSTGDYFRYVDGTLEGSATYSTKISSSPILYFMRNRGGAHPANGGFAEMIIAEDIDDSSRQRVEGYLAWKWGLVDELESTHPYKSTPPN